MNNQFFERYYNEDITDEGRHVIQRDGYAYATAYSNKDLLLLVLDNVSNNRENYQKNGGSRLYDGVICVNFLDKGIMTKDVYDIGRDVQYLLNFTGNYELYNKDRFLFELREINESEEISKLRKVFYFLQPTLQSMTLAAGGESNTASDPNYYEGCYYLQNGEEYTILKHRNLIEFYRGKKSYTYLFKKKDERTDCFYREEIDFTTYGNGIELQKLRKKIKYEIGEMLDYRSDELIELTKNYVKLKEQLLRLSY